MDLGIKDRVALVAAASKGLGFAAALELAREGARVFVHSVRDEERASAAADANHTAETGALVAGICRGCNRQRSYRAFCQAWLASRLDTSTSW